MSKASHFFPAVFSTLVALSLVTGCGSSPKPPVMLAQPALVAQADEFYISAQSDFVFSIDVAGLQSSGYFKYFETKFKAQIDSALGKVAEVCRFDPMKTVKHIAGGVKPGSNGASEMVAIVRGITKAQLEQCLSHPDLKSNYTYADGMWAGTGDLETSAMKFVGEDVLLIAMDVAQTGPAAIAKALDGSAGIAKSPAFTQLWVGAPTGHLRFAANGAASVFNEARKMGINPKSLVGAISMTANLELVGSLTLDSADAATSLVSQYNMFKGMVTGFVKSVEVNSKGATVAFAVAITPDQSESLAQMVLGGLGAM
jgi:hypothetical protein